MVKAIASKTGSKNITIPTFLIAPCGMNCRLCYAYRREKNKCPGCRRFNSKEPVSIARCRIKNCDKIVKGKIKFCYDCDIFPCARLKHLDKRYRTKYDMSMIENLEDIKKSGVQKFISKEKEKWICSECGELICVHKPECISCGYKWSGC